MDNKKTHFVKTSDLETAKALRAAGLTELDKEGSMFVFLNDWTKQSFSDSDIDEKKVSFSNRISV